MTPVDDLVAWLTQIWDEQEAIVCAAIEDDGGQDGGLEDSFDVLTRGRDQAGPLAFEPRFGEPLARMMVRNTPRLALARIAADRQILAWCTERHRIYVGTVGDDPSDPKNYVPGDFVHGSDSVVVRLLAQPYADRPGYQEAWKP